MLVPLEGQRFRAMAIIGLSLGCTIGCHVALVGMHMVACLLLTELLARLLTLSGSMWCTSAMGSGSRASSSDELL